MIYKKQKGVPRFESIEYAQKSKDYVLLIPIINEGIRILKELKRAYKYQVSKAVDIVICDGGSTDGSVCEENMKKFDVKALLIKKGPGKQGAQIRMGIWWAMQHGYKGVITIDGNNKDNIEAVPQFVSKLEEGYDMIQGSRFIKGGKAISTPFVRLLAIRLIHAPLISLTARHWFTDTTNAYRGYSMRYLQDNRVQPLRDVFMSYELLAYLSVRASQLGYRVCEIPVTRKYPKGKKIPTKIKFFRGNIELMKVLIENMMGAYKI